MARGWTEFWLIWVAVDIVGVPLLFSAGYYASAVMYLFYGFFTLTGFFVWWRAEKRERAVVPAARQLPYLRELSGELANTPTRQQKKRPWKPH